MKETLLQRTGPAAFLAAALLAAPSCSQEGSFENGRVLFGPGVFGAQGDGIAWDGTTSIPRSLLTAVTEAMETGNPDAVQAVYLDNIDALVPPILSGEIGYAKRSYGMELYRTDETGFWIQFTTVPRENIRATKEDSLRMTLYDERYSQEEPVMDMDLEFTWRDCQRLPDDVDVLEKTLFEETGHRVVWYEVWCLWDYR